MDNKQYRAGIIPYIIQNNEVYMLFMKPSNPKYGGDKYQIAKGKIDEGENSIQAAKREGLEELGLFSGNIIETYDLGVVLGRTYVYVAKIKDKNAFGDPHFETGSTSWMNLSEFLSEGRELHRPVIKAAYRLIVNREKL